VKKFLEAAATQDHPLRILKEFLDQELSNEKAKKSGLTQLAQRER